MATTLTSTGITFTNSTSVNNTSLNAYRIDPFAVGSIVFGFPFLAIALNRRETYSVGTVTAGSSLGVEVGVFRWDNSTAQMSQQYRYISYEWSGGSNINPTAPSASNTAYNLTTYESQRRNVFNTPTGSWKSMGNFAIETFNDRKIWGGVHHWRYA